VLQHLCFMVSALLFWWAVLFNRHAGFGALGAAAALFTTALHTSLLGALLSFSSTLWYPVYGALPRRFGVSPLEDQQLGGLIMWVPGGLVFLAAALVLLVQPLSLEQPRRAD